MTFIKDNQEERYRFIDKWSEYVRTSPDKVWSKEQNVIIDSSIKSATISKKEYLKLKKS